MNNGFRKHSLFRIVKDVEFVIWGGFILLLLSLSLVNAFYRLNLYTTRLL
jgi:hypothetical protein